MNTIWVKKVMSNYAICRNTQWIPYELHCISTVITTRSIRQQCRRELLVKYNVHFAKDNALLRRISTTGKSCVTATYSWYHYSALNDTWSNWRICVHFIKARLDAVNSLTALWGDCSKCVRSIRLKFYWSITQNNNMHLLNLPMQNIVFTTRKLKSWWYPPPWPPT